MAIFFALSLAAGLLAGDKGDCGEDGDDEEGGMLQEGLEHLGVPRGDKGNDESRREGCQETYEENLTVRKTHTTLLEGYYEDEDPTAV